MLPVGAPSGRERNGQEPGRSFTRAPAAAPYPTRPLLLLADGQLVPGIQEGQVTGRQVRDQGDEVALGSVRALGGEPRLRDGDARERVDEVARVIRELARGGLTGGEVAGRDDLERPVVV